MYISMDDEDTKTKTVTQQVTTNTSQKYISKWVAKDDFVGYESVDFKLDSLLEDLYYIQSPSGYEDIMREYIISKLSQIKNLKYELDKMGNLFVTKGNLKENEFYPCVVAHMDTVFSYTTEKIKIDKRKDSESKRYVRGYLNDDKTDYFGLGADDKNGIFVALKMLKEKDVIKGAFFVGEERGCIGSNNCDLDFFENCGYLLQGDRRNGGDLITEYSNNKTCSQDFIKKISGLLKLFKFKEESGLYTDVMILAGRGVGLSVVNYSVGYYNPHMDNEYTNIDELYNAKKFTSNMIDLLGMNKYEHKYTEKSYSTLYGKKYTDRWGFYDDIDDEFDYAWKMGWLDEKDFCSCSVSDKENLLIDMDCEVCNSIVNSFTEVYCKCGMELIQRDYTMQCPMCKTHKLIKMF